MNVNFGWLVKTIVVTSLCFTLSGCFTLMLGFSGGNERTTTKEWSKDTITGLSLAQDSNGNKGYVFVGKEFDYLLSQGADRVVQLLKDPKIDRNDLQVTGNVEFVLNDSKKKFNGSLMLKYEWKTEEAKLAAVSYGFYCNKTSCSYTVSGLEGSIHQKNKQQDYSQVLAFHHPFIVGFYEYKTSGISRSAADALIPVAITLDIVTAPLQLVAFAIMSTH